MATYLKEIANDNSSFCDSGWFSVSPCSDAGWSDSFFLTRKAPFFLTLFSMSSALSLFRLSWYHLQIKKQTSFINTYHKPWSLTKTFSQKHFVYSLFFKMCIWLLWRRWKKKGNNTISERMDTIHLITLIVSKYVSAVNLYHLRMAFINNTT